MTKEERIANMAADIAEWRILEDSNEKYLEVECGEFLICLLYTSLRESSKVISVNMYQKILAIYIFLSCIEIYSPTKRRLGAKLVIAELAETKDN